MVILGTNHMHRSRMKERIARFAVGGTLEWCWMRDDKKGSWNWELHKISPGGVRSLVKMGPRMGRK